MDFFNDFFGKNGSPFQRPPFTNNMGMGMGMDMNTTEPQTPADNSRLYNILGVDKKANEKDIRKAYLKRSTKGEYRHPDKGGDQEKFKILVQAYEVLKTPSKREDYDKYGEEIFDSDFQQKKQMHSMFFNRSNTHNSHTREKTYKKGPATKFDMKVTLEELCKNTTKKIRITRKVVFEKLSSKKVPDDNVHIAWETCNHCNGRGTLTKIQQLRPGMIQQIQMPCQHCNRTGSILKNEYEIRNTSEILEVFIEKGSVNKDRIVFKSKGNVTPGRLPSDLIVNIKEVKHPSYTRKENDLLIKKQITLDEALFGHTFYLYHPDGRTLNIHLTDIITPKNNLRAFDGGGMPIKGDSFTSGKLFIYFEIAFPTAEQLATHDKLKDKLINLLNMIPNYKNPVHKYDFNPTEAQLETVEDGTLNVVDINDFGIKNKKYKNANDSDSEDDMRQFHGVGEVPQCKQM